VNKTKQLSFTIKNTAKTTLQGFVDDSELSPPLAVVSGAGSFALAKNKTQKVTVEFSPTAAGKVSGTITITTGASKTGTQTVSITGKGK